MHEPVSEICHGLTVPSGNEILSIQLRPDGLSFACAEKGELRSSVVRIPAEKREAGFEYFFSCAKWPEKAFSSVQVCVPTECVLLIPAELNDPERYGGLMAALGYGDDPGAHIFAQACPEGQVLLHAVCETVVRPLTEKYGDSLSFYHPLFVSLAQPGENSTILRIDGAGGYGNFTLTNGKNILFTDVFPWTGEADLLLMVNRIIVSNKIGSFRIICSGENSDANAALLSRHYREVGVHPQGEFRDLLYPFPCE